MIRLFLLQNINLDEDNPGLAGTDPFNRTRPKVNGEEVGEEVIHKKRHLNRFGFGIEETSSVTIKSKLGAVRLLDDSSSEDDSDAGVVEFDPLERFDFTVYTTLDNVPPELSKDLLQRLLINEMRDTVVVCILQRLAKKLTLASAQFLLQRFSSDM